MGSSKADPPMAQSEPGASPAAGGASERLESWKDIANYLKRGVTTVQRWEKQEGLPVHRHLHDKLGTVYAYKPEIDAWWENGRSRLEQQEQVRASSRRPPWWAVAAAVVVVAAAGVGLWLWLGQQPALPFEERDWVLIASFENRTGEAVFDGTLEYALERELSNSRFVNVVSRERINDTLRLMKKPLDAPITATLGREVALRDGGVRALISGRVEKLDTTYVLSAALVNPTRGTTVASFSEQAEGQKQVVPAVRRLSDRVRNTLGEKLSSIQESEQKLEKVTTPSLRALQLFTEADALVRHWKVGRGGQAPAEELLKQAVAEDPEFASGYISLAWAIRNQGKPEGEYRPHAERAVELSETTTDRERYFILGSYYSLMGQHEKAIAPYQALLRLYPDHYWGVYNLIVAYGYLGRLNAAAPYEAARADLRPTDFDAQARAARALANWKNDLEQARPYLQRARKLADPEIARRFPWRAASLELISSYDLWLRGDLDNALQQVETVVRSIPARAAEERDPLAYVAGVFLLSLGKIVAAEEIFGAMTNLHMRADVLALAALIRGDEQALKEQLRGRIYRSYATMLLPRVGLLADAKKMLQTVDIIPTQPGILKHLRGEIALAQGKTEEATQLLEEGVELMRHSGGGSYFLAVESLARAWEEQGELSRAAQVLERAAAHRGAIFYTPAGPLWVRIQWQRARLYRKMARETEAQAIEHQLRGLLALADPAHPILLQLRATQALAAAQPPN